VGEAVNQFWRCLIDFVSRGLEPAEREAVLGDLAELTASGAGKLRDVLGLVVRRQAALWWDWRPWVVVTALVAQIGQMLAINAAALGLYAHDLYFWIVRNRAIDPGFLRVNNLPLQHHLPLAGLRSFLLASWAWGSGFTLASLSRRTTWANSTLFCFALLLPFQVFLAAFHMLIFSLVTLAAFVIAPSAWGIVRGHRAAERRGLLAIIWGSLYIAASAIQIGLERGQVVFWSGTWLGPLPLDWGPPAMFVFYAHWPVFYAIAVLYWRRWRSPAISI
jgi:hypothetical protein